MYCFLLWKQRGCTFIECGGGGLGVLQWRGHLLPSSLSHILQDWAHLSGWAVIVLIFLSARAWRAAEQQDRPQVLGLGPFITSASDLQFRWEWGWWWVGWKAVKVMSGNLVHPQSRVTWQVHDEIRLSRKTLPKKERNGCVCVCVGGSDMRDKANSQRCYNRLSVF